MSTPTESKTCAICYESLNEQSLILMPCCGREESTVQYCCDCLLVIANNGINNTFGKCPSCSKYFTVDNKVVTIRDSIPLQCLMCMQAHNDTIAIGPGRNICPRCILGHSYCFSYECKRCHNMQSIPHPMWTYQPSPTEYTTATWACQRCGDYTHWRISASDVNRVPPEHTPEGWNLRVRWLETVRLESIRNRQQQQQTQQQDGNNDTNNANNGAPSDNSNNGGSCRLQ